MKKEYIECGKICSAHGVRGAIKVEHWCDTAQVLSSQKQVYFKASDGSFEKHSVISASPSNRFVIMTLDGVDTREAAQAEKNRVIYLHRGDIPLKRGAVLISDMIGLAVIDVDTGRIYGELVDVTDGVRSKLYTVRSEKDGDVLLPGVPEFIKEIDVERGIFVRPIPGFFSENDV